MTLEQLWPCSRSHAWQHSHQQGPSQPVSPDQTSVAVAPSRLDSACTQARPHLAIGPISQAMQGLLAWKRVEGDAGGVDLPVHAEPASLPGPGARLAGQAEEWLRLLQLGREVCLWFNVVPGLCRMCCHCPHCHTISLGQPPNVCKRCFAEPGLLHAQVDPCRIYRRAHLRRC